MSQPSPGSPFSDHEPGQIFQAEIVDPWQPQWDPVVPRQPAKTDRMVYWGAFTAQFRDPNWMTNVLWGSLGMFVPIAGPLLLTGYLMRNTDSLIRTSGSQQANFNLDDAEDYFFRGLWAVLANMIVGFIFTPVVFLLSFAAFFGGGAVLAASGVMEQKGNSGAQIAAVVGVFGFAFVCMICVNILQYLIATPLILRGGLGNDFGQTFNFAWTRDFLGKMWVEMVNGVFFILLLGFVLGPLGFLCCFVGIIPVSVLLHFTTAHFWYQWYTLYLQRGGEPIQMKVPRPRK